MPARRHARAQSGPHLSPRERQVLETLHRLGRATVGEVAEAMDEPASYAAVRAALRTLAEKGEVRHEYDGPRYVYEATAPTEQVSRSALEHLVRTFFGGSVPKAVTALLDLPTAGLSGTQRKRIARMIDDAKREGR